MQNFRIPWNLKPIGAGTKTRYNSRRGNQSAAINALINYVYYAFVSPKSIALELLSAAIAFRAIIAPLLNSLRNNSN